MCLNKIIVIIPLKIQKKKLKNMDMKNVMLNYNTKLLKQLEQILAAFDKIFFLPYITEYAFLQSGLKLSRMKNKKILFIIPNLSIPEYTAPIVKRISMEETEKLIQLYHTYEFADNFHMIADETSFAPNIFNFVTTGVLTYEEAWQALLS